MLSRVQLSTAERPVLYDVEHVVRHFCQPRLALEQNKDEWKLEKLTDQKLEDGHIQAGERQ